MSSAICFNLDQSKILSSGNGLKSKLKACAGKRREYVSQMKEYFCGMVEKLLEREKMLY